MKKIVLSSLLATCIFALVGCSANNNDVSNELIENEEPVITEVIYNELTQNDIDSVLLSKDGKSSKNSIFDITEEEVLELYGETVSESSDDNTKSLMFKDGTFVFDKETKGLISCTLTNEEMVHVRGIKLGYLLEGVVSKLPQDDESVRLYIESMQNKSELEGTNHYVLYDNLTTHHTVELECTIDGEVVEKNVLVYSTNSYKITFDFVNKNGFNLLEKITYSVI